MGRMIAVALIAALAAACAAGGNGEANTAGDVTRTAAEAGIGDEPVGDAAAPADGTRGADSTSDAQDGATDVDLGALAEVGGDRIVRDGTVSVGVADFDDGFARFTRAAERLGGTMLETTRATADGATSGAVTVRVPAEHYDALLRTVSEVGEVREQRVTSDDVSAEFVDLEARLRHNEAQERFHLSLLDDAEDVEDAVAVQQRVADIQQTIEQIRGRLRFLEERTRFSRLTVELFEAGAQGPPGAQRGLSSYWRTATDALVAALGTLLVVGVVLAPVALLLVAAFAAWRALRRRSTADAAGTAERVATPDAG